jgi:hypothetical protein
LPSLLLLLSSLLLFFLFVIPEGDLRLLLPLSLFLRLPFFFATPPSKRVILSEAQRSRRTCGCFAVAVVLRQPSLKRVILSEA